MKQFAALICSAALALSGVAAVMPAADIGYMLSARADGTAVLDEATGTLTLSGNVAKSDVTAFAKNEAVKSVVCTAGTVLPAGSGSLFENFTAESIDLSNADTSGVTSMSFMFDGCKNLKTLDISNFNTENVTTMSFMFAECENLETVDTSKFNTENVTTMTRMFNHCHALKELDLSSFKTPKLTGMSGMFGNCQALEKLDLSSFDTSNVTDIGFMFYNCKSLTELNLTSFNTSKVTTIQQTFCNCEKLPSLDLSSFDTTNVTDMQDMFDDCYCLTTLDLSNFNTANVQKVSSMFNGCKALTTIYASELWSNKNMNAEDTMFNGCEKLVGGNGTAYATALVKTRDYACIDKAGQPGYLTYKASGTPAPVVTTTADTTTTTAITTTGANPATTPKPETTTAVTTTAITTTAILDTTAPVSTTVLPVTDPAGDEPWTDSYQIKNGGHYFILGDVCGKPGETVDVPVYVFGDPGTAGIQVFFGYDKALKLNKFNMSADNYAYRLSAQRNVDVYPAAYVLATDKNLTAKDGAILTMLNFTIPATAKEGTCYDVSFMETDDSINMVVDYNYSPLNVKYYNGSITVLSEGKTALNRTEVTLIQKGETANLTLFNAPGAVTWTSSDPKVATVDENGFVTAVSGGEVTITAECGGKTYTATVKVTLPEVPEQNLRGDFDGDGEVTANDAQSVLVSYTEELASGTNPMTASQINACDIDGDGKITAADAQYILLYFTENTVTGNPTTWDQLVK